MRIVNASAPGKLVLLGEYAVLEGAPALAVAVDRRARVRIRARSDGVCEVSAPDLGVVGARRSIDGAGQSHWSGGAVEPARLRLVDCIWQSLAREELAPAPGSGLQLHLDTSGFFEGADGARSKLGLGSSAALTVALASALAAFAGRSDVVADRAHWLQRLVRMHSAWQDGHGSGVDIAASLAGGLVAYRRCAAAGAPSCTSLAWPLAGVECLFVWSGQTVSTADSLQRLAQWRRAHPDAYAAHMQELGALAEAATEAVQQGNGAAFVALVADYAKALERFGAASGLEIFSPAQKQLVELAAQSGASYKPCGAGGDFGVMVVQEADRLARIERSMIASGLHAVSLAVDPHGLRCSRPATRRDALREDSIVHECRSS